MFSSGTWMFTPASGWPWSEITRPDPTPSCPHATAGVRNASAARVPTIVIAERINFFMRTSDRFEESPKNRWITAYYFSEFVDGCQKSTLLEELRYAEQRFTALQRSPG